MTLPVTEQTSLQAHNTLALDARARYFIPLTTRDQIPEAIDFARRRDLPLVIVGEGSNVVFSGDISGVVLKIALCGIEVLADGEEVLLEAAAGENWHQLVTLCLREGYFGVENLAFIPGTVGAAPIQNIGAYGVELDSVLESVTGWDLEAGEWRTLSNAACRFGYRDSIFKHALRDRFIVASVRLRLSRHPRPNIAYQSLSDYFETCGNDSPTPEDIARAVIAIRRARLPDPAELPNAGSFFKNPVIPARQHAELVARYPDLVCYPQPDGCYKLAAGWLVERAGWRGETRGAVGMHREQALVLVNYGGASGAAVLELANRVAGAVRDTFGVTLEIEPRVY